MKTSPESELKHYINSQGFQIDKAESVQHGKKITISSGSSKSIVTIYRNGTIQIQGKDSSLKDNLLSWKNTRTPSSNSPIKKEQHISQSSNFNASYQISNENYSSFLQKIQSLNAEIEEIALCSEHQKSIHSITRDGCKVRITLYKTGSLQVQGLRTKLTNDIDQQLDLISERSFKERVLSLASNKEEEDILCRNLGENNLVKHIHPWILEHFDIEVLNFLPKKEQENYISGVFTLLIAKENPQCYKNTSILVMPFARAYEGFLINFLCEVGFLDENDLNKDMSEIKIGESLQLFFTEIEKDDKSSSKGWKDSVLAAWRDIRHKIMHAEPNIPRTHSTLSAANQDIGTINRAMCSAYEYAIKKGRIKVDHNSKTKKQKSIEQLISTPQPDIGADETGKGDYFGPLVVAAVYGDQNIRQLLKNAGIKESKKLKNSSLEEIQYMADKIREITKTTCKISEPLDYNKSNPPKSKNLNNYMTDLHIKNIQNLLKTVDANRILLDKYDSTNNNLVEQEFQKNIPSVQFCSQQKADSSNILVAAASVIALEAQRLWFAKVLEDTGIKLVRGSSDEPGITAGVRKLIQHYDIDQLSSFAKLSHKTTAKIEKSLGIQIIKTK